MSSNWFIAPDQVGGWQTAQENLSNNEIRLLNQTNFFTAPIDYQINDPQPQYYPIGLMPVGLDVTFRALIGVKPYG
jgi:hypothetical protein